MVDATAGAEARAALMQPCSGSLNQMFTVIYVSKSKDVYGDKVSYQLIP